MNYLKVEDRTPGLSSGELRRARKENRIPAAIYGQDFESRSVFLRAPGNAAKELSMGRHLRVELDGEILQTSIEEVQRDPITRKPLHVSLQAVTVGQEMKVEVPIVLVGEAIGLKSNGVITQVKSMINLKGKFEDLPEQVELDVSDLDVTQHLELKDIPLPKGVEIAEETLEQVVVSCAYSNVTLEPEPEETIPVETEVRRTQES